MSSEERLLIESVADESRSSGELKRDQWDRLRSAFGERFERAWRMVSERRIKLYTFSPSGRTVWIAVGREGEYQILPRSGYCDCEDFYFRIVDEGSGVCYHLIAQRLAEALGSFDDVREEDEFFEPLMDEWRRQLLQEDSEN